MGPKIDIGSKVTCQNGASQASFVGYP